MAGKKNFISIKRGLSQDAKHRERMANRIWLFMHIIDRTDWETGIVYDWRDKDEAEDMTLSLNTLRKQRQELEELGYITCVQKQAKQEIIVHNWSNPRNYSGEVLNGKGSKFLSPSEAEGDIHGDTHGSKDVIRDFTTPPLDSKIKNQRSHSRATPARDPDPLFDAIVKVCQIDPTIKANGSSIGKVRSGLLGASPPYSAEEVLSWGESQTWRNTPPSIWQLQAGIGSVRGTNGNGHKSNEPAGFAGLREWIDEQGITHD